MDEGTRVHDTEDESPDDAVVVWRPEDTTIADWEYEVEGETYTTAESNPDYPADDQLIVVSFVDDLDEQWPAWTDADPDELIEGVRDREVPTYGFPESRLEPIETTGEDGPPAAFADLRERFEDNGFAVAVEGAEMRVEKYGDEYVIEPDGSIEGEGGLKGRVTSLVTRYM